MTRMKDNNFFSAIIKKDMVWFPMTKFSDRDHILYGLTSTGQHSAFNDEQTHDA